MAESRYRALPGGVHWVVSGLSAVAIVQAVFYSFNVTIRGWILPEAGFFYILIALYLPVVFLVFPGKKGEQSLPRYDIAAAVASFAFPLYFVIHANEMFLAGWQTNPPLLAAIFGAITLVLIVEAVRRTVGLALAIPLVLFAIYPLVAPSMPALLSGIGYSPIDTIALHTMSLESILGIPMQVFGKIIIAFMLFAVALIGTGGGTFFLNLALSILGHVRGGPAKVAVVASALFGSLSGSALANVMTTGSFTIPAMKQTGFKPQYAASVEACTSTGGVLMPPIMGAAAFIMADFLCISYAEVCLAAAIPSILYYFSLFLQVDGQAAKAKLKGLPRSEMPSVVATIKGGWPYILAFVYLIYGVFWLRVIAVTAYQACLLLLLLSMARPETRLTPRKFLDIIHSSGRTLCELTAILAGVGMMIGGLTLTGAVHTFPAEILKLAGGNLPILLILGAVMALIMGMGMTITAVYVILAILLVPALISLGLNPIACHLFVLYCSILSNITPPVAVVAYAAASLAGSAPMRTGFQAMRMGAVIFLLPFLFILNPAIILQGTGLAIATSVPLAFAATFLLASGVEGYLIGIGRARLPARVGLIAAGISLFIPGWATKIAGGVIAVITICAMRIARSEKVRSQTSGANDGKGG